MSRLLGCDYVGCDALLTVASPEDAEAVIVETQWLIFTVGESFLRMGQGSLRELAVQQIVLCPKHAKLISWNQWKERTNPIAKSPG